MCWPCVRTHGVEDEGWQKYLMVGNGDSYGVKGYLYQRWKRWSLQLSYAYSRAGSGLASCRKREGALFVRCTSSVGGSLVVSVDDSFFFLCRRHAAFRKSPVLNEDYEPLSVEEFREKREPLNYRVDVGYSYRKSFGDKLLLLRLGVYNVVGNPSEEDILSFYSVHWSGNCLPYGSLSFKFLRKSCRCISFVFCAHIQTRLIIFAASIDETMSIKELQEVYAKHPNVAGLASLRKNKDIKTVYLEGMHSSCASLYASVSVKTMPGIHVFILNDLEEAGYFTMTWCRWTERLMSCFSVFLPSCHQIRTERCSQ